MKSSKSKRMLCLLGSLFLASCVVELVVPPTEVYASKSKKKTLKKSKSSDSLKNDGESKNDGKKLKRSKSSGDLTSKSSVGLPAMATPDSLAIHYGNIQVELFKKTSAGKSKLICSMPVTGNLGGDVLRAIKTQDVDSFNEPLNRYVNALKAKYSSKKQENGIDNNLQISPEDWEQLHFFAYLLYGFNRTVDEYSKDKLFIEIYDTSENKVVEKSPVLHGKKLYEVTDPLYGSVNAVVQKYMVSGDQRPNLLQHESPLQICPWMIAVETYKGQTPIDLSALPTYSWSVPLYYFLFRGQLLGDNRQRLENWLREHPEDKKIASLQIKIMIGALQKMVRDVTALSGKKVEFVISGEQPFGNQNSVKLSKKDALQKLNEATRTYQNLYNHIDGLS